MARSFQRAFATGFGVALAFAARSAAAWDLPLFNEHDNNLAVDRDKIFTIGGQPLTALLTQRFSLEVSLRMSEHHAITLTPYYVFFISRDYLAQIRGDQSQTVDHNKGEGIEVGYRYRSAPITKSKSAIARLYGGPSLLVAQYMLSRGEIDSKTGSESIGPSLFYSRRGFAMDVGIEATVSPIFYFGAAVGLEYAWNSKSFDDAQPLALTSAIYGEGLRPRVGGATGFTF